MKTKITIYVLDKGWKGYDSQNAIDSREVLSPGTENISTLIPPQNYLIGLDTSDIKRSASAATSGEEGGGPIETIEIITITDPPHQVPGVTLDGLESSFGSTGIDYEVQTDDMGRFININSAPGGNLKYYIKKRPGEIDGKFPASPASSKTSFTFYINPNHITQNYKKLFTEIRTRGGWEIQHWGNALTEISVQGLSGTLLPKNLEPGKEIDITTSEAWIKLSQLKKLYYDSNSNPNESSSITFGMNYYDTFYVGYFTSFMGPEGDAESPFLVKYNFTFKVIDELSLATVSNILGNI